MCIQNRFYCIKHANQWTGLSIQKVLRGIKNQYSYNLVSIIQDNRQKIIWKYQKTSQITLININAKPAKKINSLIENHRVYRRLLIWYNNNMTVTLFMSNRMRRTKILRTINLIPNTMKHTKKTLLLFDFFYSIYFEIAQVT